MNKAFCLAIALLFFALALPAHAQDEALAEQVRALTLNASKAAAPDMRVEVELGQLDPRLKLAPCNEVQPYLPPNARAWGATRVGLRCVRGPVKWNVYLPVTVKVFAPALVAAHPLPAGTVLGAADLRSAEIDIAAGTSPALREAPAAVGRTLSRALPAGATLHAGDLKPRQWFAAGDSVRIVAQGSGYAVSGEGQALAPGIEGQPVRVRTESGRIVTGMAVAERRVEVSL